MEDTSSENAVEESTTEEYFTEETTEETDKDDEDSKDNNFDGSPIEDEISTESDTVTPVGTGDNNNYILWLILAGACACIIALTTCTKTKEISDK